jgi:hypothetical protein
MKLKNYYKHLKTILRHKYYVFLACKDCGITWRGIKHDLSKFSPYEFLGVAKHYIEGKTPLAVIKEKYGYSKEWLHHKGRNTHHWAYWIYLDTCENPVTAIKMPYYDVIEMICDWIGASKAYNKGKWTNDSNWEWYKKNKDEMILHDDTRKMVEDVLLSIKVFGWHNTSNLMKYKEIGYEWY